MPANGCQPFLPEILSLHGKWRSRHPAALTPDDVLTWATLDARTARVASGLIDDGLKKGDRVGIVMSNGAPMLEAMLGAMKAGTVVVPLNPTVTDQTLVAMLEDAGVSALFATGDHVSRLSAFTKPCAVRIVADPAAKPEPDGWTNYRKWLGAQRADATLPELAADDLCNIIYSSGTTGQPKGIVHSHGGRMAWAHDLGAALRYDCGARTLVVTGLYSNISWAGMLPTLMHGGTLIIRPSFEAGDTLRVIAEERVTHTSMVPVQFQRMIEHKDFPRTDRTSVRAMMCCGAPLPVAVKERLFETFANGVIELYGSTEGVITTLAPEEARGRMASVGKPLPGEDLVILGDDDKPVAPGESGEIVALSRFQMIGYWNKPDATRDAHWIDPKGRRWLRSGDIGRIDEEGYLFITDRKKDMIISGGQNVYPSDIEAVLRTHPDISDCAVFGIPSDRWGETPLALAVVRDAAALQAGALRDWLNARVAKYQRVDRVELRGALPRNATGKLLRRELREPYWKKSG
jgi:acyl-CoA synthetase (AMP-forming)/AMP-acid ligase II